MSNRVPTGITGLDDLIEGGFPSGSLILLAGSPGTGKTIASAHFIYHGITKLNENSIYVSFAERRKFFLESMRRFSFNFEELESKGKFKFLDMIATREEGMGSSINTILKEALAINAKRLVIDSFSAMAQAFKRKIDARVILHTLDKMLRQIGCTTLLVVEIPTGSKTIGFGFEEFVADGIILFETINEKEGIRKRAVILKMRGTNHNQNYSNIVITEKGISLTRYVT